MQCQGQNYEPWVVAHAKALGGVKLLNPQYGDWRKFADAAVPILGRMVWPNDSTAPRRRRRGGCRSVVCRLLADGAAMRWHHALEGPNEPTTWTIADAQRLDAFTARLAISSRQRPATGRAQLFDRPSRVRVAAPGNALARSTTWAATATRWPSRGLTVTNGARLPAGRGRKRFAPLGCECRRLSLARRALTGGRPRDGRLASVGGPQHLHDAASPVRAAARLAGARAGSGRAVHVLSTGWPSFDIDEATSAMLVNKWEPVAAEPGPLPAITPEYLELARGYKVPINPDGALAKSMMAAGQLPASDEFDHTGAAARQWGYRRSDASWHLWQWEAGKAPRIVHSEAAQRE